MSAIAHVRFPSLELNWLPVSCRKGLQTPRIVFMDAAKFGGCHVATRYRDEPVLCRHTDIDVSRRPLIILNERTDIAAGNGAGDLLAGTIAHEYRHHMQWEAGQLHGLGSSSFNFEGEGYESAIATFFRSQPHEMDALRFQLRYAPDDVARRWWELLQ